MAGSHLDVGGLDGSVKIDARNSSIGSTIKVQVNENGRALSIQGNGETNVCILATPQLELELQTSAPCLIVRDRGRVHAWNAKNTLDGIKNEAVTNTSGAGGSQPKDLDEQPLSSPLSSPEKMAMRPSL
eukprot:jgi/Picre1/28863/NNA_004259.t1